MFSPLWAPWPQTPQGGEYGIFAAVAHMLAGPSNIYSDCQSVVCHAQLARQQALSHKRMHSGFMLQARMGDLSRVQAVIKVSAHQALDESLPAREYFLRLGNHRADRLANIGREQHALPSPAESDAIWRKVSIARLVAKLAARIMPLWPRLDLQDVEWLAPESGVSGRQGDQAHSWVQIRQSWQCSVCLRGSRLPQPPASKCPGADGLRGLKAEDLSNLGHTMAAYDCSDGSFVAVCTRCKQYSTGGSVRGLRERCPAEARYCGQCFLHVCQYRCQSIQCSFLPVEEQGVIVILLA